ncbi:MAG: hypothetical protein H8E25_13060 [Planctomycetes bacterium]|nr:hypothetical protein [Planctomycetota bacterium]
MAVKYYRLIFLLGFILIPSVIWGVQVKPDLESRDTYLQRQENAISIQKENAKLPEQRDQLADMWRDFLPVADEALENLEHDLNPHLVQKRIDRAARELNCDMHITPKPTQKNDRAARFVITGSGRYTDLVKLVDQLEQGQHFVRFDSLTFVMPSLDYAQARTGAVRVTGAIMIPMLKDIKTEELK